MSSSGLQFSLPSSSLFQFPPSPEPLALPPPATGSILSAPPFSISAEWYTSVLDVKVPITFAVVYAITVSSMNAINRSRGNKPWPISKTASFFWFMVAHNVLLAVYSAWTFVGMFRALQQTLEGWSSPAGLTGTVDSLCKMHGTSGIGNAVVYDGTAWVSQSPNVLLNAAGTPESTDVGRLWNEGLAFYGWFFYLSKFYEVLDTVIILAKGKRSSTLQTYHHAGAMMCMWAGIRYMSPPIWMFVFVNSAIHTLMYTYYTLCAFNVRIPNTLKRSLTTMQIIQFLVGVGYAALHSFVSYSVPIEVPSVVDTVKTAASAASSVASAATAIATSAGVGSLIKKALFRAAGEEGLAENVARAYNPENATALKSTNHGSANAGVQYHTVYKTVPCIDTNGQTFAIWLNVLYLAPLTVLFVRFFVKSYITRTIGQAARQTALAAEKAATDALKGLERQLSGKTNGHADAKENGKY